MKVRFLSHEEAVREFDSSYYLKSHSPDEMRLKLMRYCGGYKPGPLYEQLLQCYSSKIIPFSAAEKCLIKRYFKRIYAHLRKKAPWLLPKKRTIGLIRLADGIDWNAPFTVNHSIAMTNLVLDTMKKGTAEYRSAKFCITTLCHEFVHIIQKHPELYPRQNLAFDSVYKKWGFIPIRLPLDWSQVVKPFFPLRTNPDGLNFQWLFPLRGALYMPIFGEIGGDNKTMGRMGGALVRVIIKDDKIQVTNDWGYTGKFADYLKLFYNRDEQLYHPNEIMAVYLCGVIM
jgi:hypothetical protein